MEDSMLKSDLYVGSPVNLGRPRGQQGSQAAHPGSPFIQRFEM